MISDELQYRIHLGDRNAFCQLFSCYGREVYLSALESLGDTSAARDAAKQVFLRLQRELRAATGPIDVETRIGLLTKAEIANVAVDQHTAAEPIRSWEAFSPGPCQATEPPCPQDAPAADAPPDAAVAPVEQMQPDLPQEAVAQTESPPAAPDQLPPQAADVPPMPPPHIRPRRRLALLWFLVTILGLVLIWLVLGVLMDIYLLPPIDLGYTWFNEHVYRLFRLPWNGA